MRDRRFLPLSRRYFSESTPQFRLLPQFRLHSTPLDSTVSRAYLIQSHSPRPRSTALACRVASIRQHGTGYIHWIHNHVRVHDYSDPSPHVVGPSAIGGRHAHGCRCQSQFNPVRSHVLSTCSDRPRATFVRRSPFVDPRHLSATQLGAASGSKGWANECGFSNTANPIPVSACEDDVMDARVSSTSVDIAKLRAHPESSSTCHGTVFGGVFIRVSCSQAHRSSQSLARASTFASRFFLSARCHLCQVTSRSGPSLRGRTGSASVVDL